jgi:hypothetical protein
MNDTKIVFIRTFVLWCEDRLKSWIFCDRIFPNHTQNSEDWDIPGVKFNYVYHRYNIMFKDNIASMLNSTPTFRREIYYGLVREYGVDKTLTMADLSVLMPMIELNDFIENTLWDIKSK